MALQAPHGERRHLLSCLGAVLALKGRVHDAEETATERKRRGESREGGGGGGGSREGGGKSKGEMVKDWIRG